MFDICRIGMSMGLATLTDEQSGWPLPVAQISPSEFLLLYPANKLLDICSPQLRLQFVHKVPS